MEPVVRINTSAGRPLPDVDADRGPLVATTRALIDRLGDHRLAPDEFLFETLALFERHDVRTSLKPWIDKAHAEEADQVLWRKTLPRHRQTFQLLYVHPHEIHPPHCHHNLISTQMVLDGGVHVREFDRVARVDARTLLLKLRTDRRFGPGEVMQTTEVSRNAHWFGCTEAPCVILNFFVLGYQEWTFDAADDRPQGRRLLDPTFGVQGDGFILAREVDVMTGHTMFGARPLADFPMPRCWVPVRGELVGTGTD
ncbi:MAG: hypothetical protein ACT4P2_12585 [Pseudomonadota bacterium]